jgi:uncharacterized protein YbjT (DUF2867 family)
MIPGVSPVAVFGGTGFLGHRIVRRLLERGDTVRAISRHPDRAQTIFRSDDQHLEAIRADIRDAESIAGAITGARAVVNAISHYSETRTDTFWQLHVECAGLLARSAQTLGAHQFVHVSGIGAVATSTSRYIRSRGEGELAVRTAFPGAVIIRPAVMFAPDDAFVSRIVTLLRHAPIFPMFGNGETRLQPVHAEDVAETVARVLSTTDPPTTIECGGPCVYTYKELLQSIAQAAGLKPAVIPVPFPVWHTLARAAELLPNPPIARNQIELMHIDNVASPALPGLIEVGIVPEPIEPVVRSIMNAKL